jgi:hypothetical protein
VAARHVPARAHAAIAVDVSGAAHCYGDATCTQTGGASAATLNDPHTFTYSITAGSGSNRVLVVSVHTVNGCNQNNNFGAATTTSVTFNGQALTRVGSDFMVGACTPPAARTMSKVWYLVNPSSGSHDLVVNLSSDLNNNPNFVAIESAFSSLTGANQSTPIRGSASANSGTGFADTASVTISSATNDLVWDSVCQGGSITSTSFTLQALMNVSGSNACDNIAASTIVASSSVSTNWVFGGSDHWADFVVSVEPVP